MKAILSLAFLASLVGCASAQPTAFERGIYNVTTQRVEVVVLRTNVTATATNIVAVPGIIEIQRLDSKPEVASTIQTAGQIGATFGLPWLTPVLGLLGGLYAWWAEYRNSRNKKAAAVLTNNVEVGYETILATAGEAVAEQFIDAIKSAQVKAGVKEDIAAVVENKVDSKEAKVEAASVVSLAKTAPVIMGHQ